MILLWKFLREISFSNNIILFAHKEMLILRKTSKNNKKSKNFEWFVFSLISESLESFNNKLGSFSYIDTRICECFSN